jgi:hypothetical protein
VTRTSSQCRFVSTRAPACSFFLLALFLSSPHVFSLFSPCFSPLLSSFFFSPFISMPFDDDDDPMGYVSLDEEGADDSPMLSAIPPRTIARLSHDQLCHNPEFMKYVSLVDALLITVRAAPSAGKFFFSSSLQHTHSLLSPNRFSFVLGPEELGVTGTGTLWRPVITSPHFSNLRAPPRIPEVNSLDPGRLQGGPRRRYL